MWGGRRDEDGEDGGIGDEMKEKRMEMEVEEDLEDNEDRDEDCGRYGDRNRDET